MKTDMRRVNRAFMDKRKSEGTSFPDALRELHGKKAAQPTAATPPPFKSGGPVKAGAGSGVFRTQAQEQRRPFADGGTTRRTFLDMVNENPRGMYNQPPPDPYQGSIPNLPPAPEPTIPETLATE